MSKEILYPKRKRCKSCQKKLENIVLQGLYCSPKCGKLPEQFKNIDDAPRGCKMQRDGSWIWKQKYRCVEEVPERLQNDPATNIYNCPHCFMFHVGHARALGTETSRLVQDSETLGSVLLRVREEKNLIRKEVAEKIKVRPIRIKEIEENADTIDTNVLFKLIKYYQMKMNLLL